MFLYNKIYLLEFVKNDGYNLHTIPKLFRNDKKIVLESVKNEGLALQFASKKLKNNKEIILEAVKNNGMALIYVSCKFYNKEILLEAIKNDCYVLQFASKELQKDNNFIIDCIINNNEMIDIVNMNNHKYNNLYLLIHNLQHNFDTKLIILDELFLNNINYISKTSHFYDILSFILINHKQVLKKFIPYIVDNLEYIQLCQEHNIHIFNIDEITSNGEYNLDNIKDKLYSKYENKIILFY